jgi:hypothetical protein
MFSIPHNGLVQATGEASAEHGACALLCDVIIVSTLHTLSLPVRPKKF